MFNRFLRPQFFESLAVGEGRGSEQGGEPDCHHQAAGRSQGSSIQTKPDLVWEEIGALGF